MNELYWKARFSMMVFRLLPMEWFWIVGACALLGWGLRRNPKTLQRLTTIPHLKQAAWGLLLLSLLPNALRLFAATSDTPLWFETLWIARSRPECLFLIGNINPTGQCWLATDPRSLDEKTPLERLAGAASRWRHPTTRFSLEDHPTLPVTTEDVAVQFDYPTFHLRFKRPIVNLLETPCPRKGVPTWNIVSQAGAPMTAPETRGLREIYVKNSYQHGCGDRDFDLGNGRHVRLRFYSGGVFRL